MKALVVTADGITPTELTTDYRDIQRHIGGPSGGLFTTCFRVDRLTGFCDDEGAINGRTDPSAIPEPGVLRRDVVRIMGPIVVVGEKRNGESRALTDEEVARFSLVDGVLLYRRDGAT